MSLTQKIMATTHHKNYLNTILQHLFLDVPPLEYKYDQDPTCWQCAIYLDSVHIGTGEGINKQHASEGAAESAAIYLRGQYPEAFR
ncbi:uncharacterized protein LACBIDRAFT_301568 [Laccaria bicolor S238N-H82]|uniref:Predicted protein n=1 Tax=Laccaria bicolor (strain S238N-H82 / ATCC MYA-4686) TaxID=486041 RepID=B0CNU6_LACBS|nr:uncharacterized protein LACBIDRAFT_301568 [Laccaria bicolor S238N-H82]EDR16003.1 predicted protein [Laccaria bicolor S238N-H82]|eukprot:XP_001874211.1 predicted protein [Laccaria bicolor S238N-H82]